MANIVLKAEKREAAGKNKVDKLRVQGLIPAVVYRKGSENLSVQVKAQDFNRVYQEVGTSVLLDLEIAGEGKKTVLVKEAQRHPYRDEFLHIDFQGVRMDEKLRVAIPVVLLNRDSVRVQPSIVLQMLDEIEVECFPADIPQQAEVDVENMQIGEVLTVADLDVWKNEKIEVLAEEEEPVVSLNEPQDQTEPEEETVEAGSVPEIGKEDGE